MCRVSALRLICVALAFVCVLNHLAIQLKLLPKVLQQRREIEKAPNLVAALGRGEWRTPQSADVKLDSINMREVTCICTRDAMVI